MLYQILYYVKDVLCAKDLERKQLKELNLKYSIIWGRFNDFGKNQTTLSCHKLSQNKKENNNGTIPSC